MTIGSVVCHPVTEGARSAKVYVATTLLPYVSLRVTLRVWRRALLNAKITALATPEDMAILRQIGSMSNNLNQLATVANATKDFKLVSWEVQARSKELKTLYNNLSNDWKHN